MSKIHTFAFYLPQYHPIKENNEWFGEGFTEWTNVGKSKPLFKGHYQPRIPADLGYYDLRLPEIREKQAQLAKYAGINAFCYYHYWFGNGRRLMEMPIEEVVRTGKPDYPFCLCWANHTFYRKMWNSDIKELRSTVLLQQEYPGEDDIKHHFYSMLHVFKDYRYYTIEDKLVFVIYDIKAIPEIERFLETWNKLAQKEGLKGFYFISYTSNIEEVQSFPYTLTDGVILSLKEYCFIDKSFIRKFQRYEGYYKLLKEIIGRWFGRPLMTVEYKDALPILLNDIMKQPNVIPNVIPNWDLSPRRGSGATIFHNSTPELFREHMQKAIELVQSKPEDKRIIFIKSWNEWGEGNYLEPDLKFGKGYLEILRELLLKNE